MNSLRRFIAGAVCPACKLEDKLFVYVLENNNVCECVACGFCDSQSRTAEPGCEEYQRRLGGETDTAVVRIVEP